MRKKGREGERERERDREIESQSKKEGDKRRGRGREICFGGVLKRHIFQGLFNLRSLVKNKF